MTLEQFEEWSLSSYIRKVYIEKPNSYFPIKE